MDRYELGLALAQAMAQIVRLRRKADRWHLARRATEEAAMPTKHHDEAGAFDAGHCRVCARQAALLDHHRRVQQEETTLRETYGWARVARTRDQPTSIP
jgi:hypothetical protein